VAIASEVQAICNLIKSQGYFENFQQLANQIRAGSWGGQTRVIDIKENYFTVFESNAVNLSDLGVDQVSRIVAFYSYCKSAIDATRPDGPAAKSDNPEDVASNIIGVEGVMMAIITLGELIIAFPKKPLPLISDDR